MLAIGSPLAPMRIGAEQVYLFGTHSSGGVHEGRDFDLIVVSGNSRGMSPRERDEILGVATARILEPIQALDLAPGETTPEARFTFFSEVLAGDAVAMQSCGSKNLSTNDLTPSFSFRDLLGPGAALLRA